MVQHVFLSRGVRVDSHDLRVLQWAGWTKWKSRPITGGGGSGGEKNKSCTHPRIGYGERFDFVFYRAPSFVRPPSGGNVLPTACTIRLEILKMAVSYLLFRTLHAWPVDTREHHYQNFYTLWVPFASILKQIYTAAGPHIYGCTMGKRVESTTRSADDARTCRQPRHHS